MPRVRKVDRRVKTPESPSKKAMGRVKIVSTTRRGRETVRQPIFDRKKKRTSSTGEIAKCTAVEKPLTARSARTEISLGRKGVSEMLTVDGLRGWYRRKEHLGKCKQRLMVPSKNKRQGRRIQYPPPSGGNTTRSNQYL